MATLGQWLTSAFDPCGFRPSEGLPRIRYFAAMRIALYEPDIPQNAGTILRLAACLGAEAHIIEPAGFPVTDRAFRRAGMDYLDQVTIVRHGSWDDFDAWRRRDGARLILFTTRGSVSYLDHAYRARRRAAVRPRVGGRARARARGRRRAADHPDPAGLALAQCGGRLRHGARRSDAADARDGIPELMSAADRSASPLVQMAHATSLAAGGTLAAAS